MLWGNRPDEVLKLGCCDFEHAPSVFIRGARRHLGIESNHGGNVGCNTKLVCAPVPGDDASNPLGMAHESQDDAGGVVGFICSNNISRSVHDPILEIKCIFPIKAGGSHQNV